MSTPTEGISGFAPIFSTGTDISVVSTNVDTISSGGGSGNAETFSSNVLTLPLPDPLPTLTLRQWMALMNSSKQRLAQQLTAADAQQMLMIKNFRLQALGWTTSVRARQAMLLDLATEEAKVYGDQLRGSLEFNEAASSYNEFINDINGILDAMRQAQAQYLAGTLSADDYNQAVDNWNNQLNSLNAQLAEKYADYSQAVTDYNQKVELNNLAIQNLNQIRSADGIHDKIPTQDPISLTLPEPSLPFLPHGPALPDPPDVAVPVPDSFEQAGFVSEQTSLSIDIVVPDAIPPQDQAEMDAIVNAIEQSVNAINIGPLSAYNHAVMKARLRLAAMQQAYLTYINNPITPASTATYQAALADYLAYANTANVELISLRQSYEQAINDYNTVALPIYNAQIAAFNEAHSLSQIPKQKALIGQISDELLPTSLPPGSPPYATDPFAINESTVEIALPSVPQGTVTPTSYSYYLEKYTFNVFATDLAGLQAYNKNLDLLQAHREKQIFRLRGLSHRVVSNAYVDRKHFEAAGLGVEAPLVGFGNRTLNRLLAKHLAAEVAKASSIETPLPSDIINTALFYAMNAYEKIALLSSEDALGFLSDNLQVASGKVGEVALSTAFLKNILSFTNSPEIKESIEDFLRASNVPEAQMTQVSTSIANVIASDLIQSAVQQVANDLQLPGLLPSTLASLESGRYRLPIAAARSQNYSDLFTEGTSSARLMNTLTNELTSTPDLNNPQPINRAIVRTVQRGATFTSDTDFRYTLTDELRREQINETLIPPLVNRASDIISNSQRETSSPRFDVQNVDKKLLAASLDEYNRPANEPHNPTAIASAIDATFAQRLVSEIQLREVLSRELQRQNFGKEKADLLAKNAAIIPSTDNPLLSPQGSFTDLNQLSSVFEAAIVERTRTNAGLALAQNLASDLNSAVFGGPTSASTQLTQALGAIGENRSFDEQTESFKNSLGELISTPRLHENNMSLAYNLLNVAAWSIMCEGMGNQPKNMKASIDIIV